MPRWSVCLVWFFYDIFQQVLLGFDVVVVLDLIVVGFYQGVQVTFKLCHLGLEIFTCLRRVLFWASSGVCGMFSA